MFRKYVPKPKKTTETKYEGRECKKCGGTLRHISNNNCITCQRENQRKARVREKAQIAQIEENLAIVVETGVIHERAKAPEDTSKPEGVAIYTHADAALKGRGVRENGFYYVDGHKVTLGQYLQAANDAIARENLTLVRSKQKPLIGIHHHRWGQ